MKAKQLELKIDRELAELLLLGIDVGVFESVINRKDARVKKFVKDVQDFFPDLKHGINVRE